MLLFFSLNLGGKQIHNNGFGFPGKQPFDLPIKNSELPCLGNNRRQIMRVSLSLQHLCVQSVNRELRCSSSHTERLGFRFHFLSSVCFKQTVSFPQSRQLRSEYRWKNGLAEFLLQSEFFTLAVRQSLVHCWCSKHGSRVHTQWSADRVIIEYEIKMQRRWDFSLVRGGYFFGWTSPGAADKGSHTRADLIS